ncbi:unnamed protein product [Mytilus edulis]|uniref:Sperm-associated antigen 17 n=1 Tax=Mytilus edulis TaxID=6550 RepID=A0A8S3TCS1_MYTED|nr:unnamed protein product [Mytilus edulis]
MVDGNVEVLYADGTISVHTGHWPLPVRSPSPTPRRAGSAMSQPERAETPTKKTAGKPAKGGKPVPEKAEEEPPEQEKKGVWTTTYPSGEKIQYKENVETEDLKPVMICVATDPETNQTMATRDDHVMTISYPDGTTIVEHADGTRITTYYRENQITRSGEESYEGEEKEIEVQTIKFVKVECPAYATVEFNSVTSENLTIFGNGTTINVFPDGYYMLHHYDSGRLEVDTEGTVTYYPRPNKITEQMLPERDLQYVLRHNADIVIESVDLEGNVFNVKSNGDYAVMTANEDDLSDTSQDESRADKRMASFKEHAPRFFICHADGSGTELMRYQDVAEYINNAEQSQATAVLRDDLPDYPGVQGITILKPYVGGLSDVWFKKYDQESIIPQGIRSRDLTTLPPKEFKTPGPKYGTTLGQGLNVGTVSKQAARIPILKCPNKLELRQIIQYKPVSNQLRDQLQAGLKDYAEYVINRNKTSEFMQPVDPRTDEEKIHAADLQEMGLHSATNPQFPPEVVKDIYEKAMTPPAPSPPPTPTPKRTKADWERDQRELAEEQEGRNALRNKKIPVYFDSEFGKAFLLSQAKDVDEILQQLSEDPRKDGTQAVRGNSFSHSNKDQVSPATSAHPARCKYLVNSSSHNNKDQVSPATSAHPTRCKYLNSSSHSNKDQVSPATSAHPARFIVTKDQVSPSTSAHPSRCKYLVNSSSHSNKDQVSPATSAHPARCKYLVNSSSHSNKDQVSPATSAHPVRCKYLVNSSSHSNKDQVSPATSAHPARCKYLVNSSSHSNKDQVSPATSAHPARCKYLVNSSSHSNKDQVSPATSAHPARCKYLVNSSSHSNKDQVSPATSAHPARCKYLVNSSSHSNKDQVSPATSAHPARCKYLVNSSSHSNKDQVSPATSAHPVRSLEAVKSGQSDRSSASPGETLTHKPGPGTPMSYSVYPETVPSRGGIRPGNPTPAHAAGQGSPAPIRPDNPTPVHAGKTVGGRPTNPTPKQAGGLDSPSDLPSQVDFPAVIMEHPTLEEGYTQDEIGNGEREAYMIRSLKMDGYLLKGGKPGAIPNNKFQMVEDPVKRKVKNSLTVGSSVRGQMELNQMKGLILLPQEVDFGVLKEGNTYSYTIHLKNTGVDSGRFKLKQPPPSTGLRVVYKPGPIAAGMKTELNLEIYAIAVGVEGESGVGSISHELEIVTETDVLFLPISATILTAYEFENREPNSPKGGKSPGTKLVSLKPPASSGIIRPRRDQLISGTI